MYSYTMMIKKYHSNYLLEHQNFLFNLNLSKILEKLSKK